VYWSVKLLLLLYDFVYTVVDNNECLNSPRPCAEVCTNTVGSYECSCDSNSEIVTEDGDCIGNEHSWCLYSDTFLSQIMMSVLLILDYVGTGVIIELVGTIVLVPLDINW